ncbi:MAG: MurR/RpiR family transcriptional regulator [Pseudomonadota bacterium]
MTLSSENTSSESDLLVRIQERYGELRRSERIVADYLRDHAGERLDASITDFGRMLGVSEATVSRVSKALGYTGYPDMKLSMAADATRSESFANIPVEVEESDPPLSVSSKLVDALTVSLRKTQALLDSERLDRAIDAVSEASRIVFIGVGGAASIANEAEHLFIKAGANVSSYGDGYTQTLLAATMTPGETVVGISHTGTTQTVANALTIARKAGAKTIAITSDPDSDVANAAEISLSTWHHTSKQIPLYGDFLEGRICQLYLIDIIYLGFLFRKGDSAKQKLTATTEALREYYSRGWPR